MHVKNILICSNLISYTYNFRKELIVEFINKGYEISIIAENDDVNKWDWFTNIGCKMFNVHINGKGTNIIEEAKMIFCYGKLLKKIVPDLVLTFTIKPNIYCGFISMLFKKPYIPMITGLGELEKKGKLQKLLLTMHKIVMPKASIIFFQNEDNKKFFSNNKIKFKRGIILPGSGINLDEHKYTEYIEESNLVKFAFVGRLTKAKGIEEVLDVAKRLKKENFPVEIHIVGKCDEMYENIISELNKKQIIIYHGLLSDTKEIYKMINCLLLPTFHPEGISNVLLEACVCGRPVICTNRTGCKEVIKDGFNGFYCQSQNPESLFESIKKFLDLNTEERIRMGKNGNELVSQKFDRKIVIQNYNDAIDYIKRDE